VSRIERRPPRRAYAATSFTELSARGGRSTRADYPRSMQPAPPKCILVGLVA
jgi:hypothetical protein